MKVRCSIAESVLPELNGWRAAAEQHGITRASAILAGSLVNCLSAYDAARFLLTVDLSEEF